MKFTRGQAVVSNADQLDLHVVRIKHMIAVDVDVQDLNTQLSLSAER